MFRWGAFKVQEIRIGAVASISFSTLLILYLLYVGKLKAIHGDYWDYISLSVTLLGFLITAYAILVTFPENHKIRALRANKGYVYIFDVFLFPAYPLLVLLILSLIGSFLKIDNMVYDAVLVFLLIWSVVGVIETVWVLKELTRIYLSVQENISN